MEEKKTPGLGIASMVCSIVSIFIFWWLGLVGIVFGAISLGKEGKNGFAIAGIIIGAVSVVLYWILLGALFTL